MIATTPPGLIGTVARTARRFSELIAGSPGATVLHERDWLREVQQCGTVHRPIHWTNELYRVPSFRHAHVEFFSIEGEIGIVHVCLFPILDAALPIFGFDMIAGREKATGCFLDLSPTISEAERVIADWAAQVAPTRDQLGEPRRLPDWASVFSAEAVAVRPRSSVELDLAVEVGLASLEALLSASAEPAYRREAMRSAQQAYVDAQRRNDRTRRMLAACIGEDPADRFIRECLFPHPPLAAAA